MTDKGPNDETKDVVSVKKGDLEKELKEAREKALREIDYFIDHLAKFATTEGWMFSVKKDFEQNGEREHMWVEVDTYLDGKFYGRLDNVPDTVKESRIEEPTSVKKDDVEDWLFFDPRIQKMVGGYSTEVLKRYQNNQN